MTISDTVKAVKRLSEKFDDLTDRGWQTGGDRYNEEEKNKTCSYFEGRTYTELQGQGSMPLTRSLKRSASDTGQAVLLTNG